jgi:hypothetical protein
VCLRAPSPGPSLAVLRSHPTADVVSPSARMQWWSPRLQVLSSKRIFIAIPRNSRKVIDKVAAVDYALLLWDPNSPGKAGDEAVPTNAKGTQI